MCVFCDQNDLTDRRPERGREREGEREGDLDTLSPDLETVNCSRAVAGCEPALRAAVNESN